MRHLFGGILITMAIISCDQNKVYENVADLNNAYWLADSAKSFEFTIPQADQKYNIAFAIRNGLEYPHNNIYIHYAISDSTHQLLDEELRNFQLFHIKTGYPLGNGSGNIYEHQFDLLTEYQFPYPGKYSITFDQFMRYDSLPQIYSVGVTIKSVPAH